MKKLFTLLTLLFIICSSAVKSDAQYLKLIQSPQGLIQDKIINDSLLSVLVFEGSYYDSINKQFGDRFRVYEYNGSFWQSICNLQVVKGDLIHKFMKIGKNYYFLGLFTRTLGLPYTKTNLIALENSVLRKVFFHQLYEQATYCEPLGGLYSTAIQKSFSANNGDTLYIPMRVFKDSIESFTACVRYWKGNADTLKIKRNNTIDAWNGPDGAYVNDFYNWKKLTGNQTAEKLISTVFKYKQGNDTFPSNINFHWIFGTAENGKFMATTTQRSGFTLLHEKNRWFTLEAPETYLFSEFIEYRGLPYARAENAQGITYLMKFDDRKWDTVCRIPNANSIAVFKNEIYIYGMYFQGTFRKLLTNVTRVWGYTYDDANGNCVRDPFEIVLPHQPLTFQPDWLPVTSDANGYYSIMLDSGSWSVQTFKPMHSLICPAINKINCGLQKELMLHIPVKRVNLKDLRLYTNSSRGSQARRGDSSYFDITVHCMGAVDVKCAYVDMKYDSRWTGFRANMPFTVVNPNHIRFKLQDLKTYSWKFIRVTMYADPANLKNGDRSDFYFAVKDSLDTDSINEKNPKNNYDSLKKVIVAAYDPNEKQADPGGTSYKLVKTIKYHIDFQNLGTDSAVNIVVVDTLDKRIDVRNLIFTAASHNYTVKLKDHVISWTFPKIMLPPASVNYKGSMGFASFVCDLDTELMVAEEISNKAYIYFDYEDAVITNDAKTKYDPSSYTSVPEFAKSHLSGTLKAHPNPAADEISVTWDSEGLHTLSLFDASGRLASVYSFRGKGDFGINIRELPAGIYFLKDEAGCYAKISILHE